MRLNKRSTIFIVLALFGLGLYFLYSRYGYLIQSARNLPRPTTINDESPVPLFPSSNPELSFINLPENFAIDYFARDVPGARSLTISEDGVVYVGTRPEGAVYALVDEDEDGRADVRYTVDSGLNTPNGVAILDGDLYVAEISRIIRYRNIDETYKTNPSFDVVYDDLPSDTHHGWRYIAFGPDDKLYISIGAPCNICNAGDPYATIARINIDGSGFEIVARGIRNTVGFTWHPETDRLWFTDNGRDWFGDDIPPDELNVITGADQHFGYPYCHGSSLEDTDFIPQGGCDSYITPVAELGPHVAALGLSFYIGDQFPNEYSDNVFIAEHGSWNRTIPIGYRITTLDIDGDSATGYRVFADGWLSEDGSALGRPVDVVEMNDGSILVSDDKAGSVYRIYYTK